MQRYRLLLVDENDVIRSGLFHILSNTLGGKVIGEANSLSEAERLISQSDVNVLLLGNHMPDGDVGEFIAVVRKERPEIRILLLLEEVEEFWSSVGWGADGYEVSKMTSYQLYAAIKAIGEGYAWLGPILSRYLLGNSSGPSPILALHPVHSPKENCFGLSVREEQILSMLSDGLSGAEIAKSLDISPKTVKLHISKCIRKMHVDNRSQAIAKFLKPTN